MLFMIIIDLVKVLYISLFVQWKWLVTHKKKKDIFFHFVSFLKQKIVERKKTN